MCDSGDLPSDQAGPVGRKQHARQLEVVITHGQKRIVALQKAIQLERKEQEKRLKKYHVFCGDQKIVPIWLAPETGVAIRTDAKAPAYLVRYRTWSTEKDAPPLITDQLLAAMTPKLASKYTAYINANGTPNVPFEEVFPGTMHFVHEAWLFEPSNSRQDFFVSVGVTSHQHSFACMENMRNPQRLTKGTEGSRTSVSKWYIMYKDAYEILPPADVDGVIV
jgi:hypothetical protein